MLRTAILKPLMFGIPKVTFFVAGSVTKDMGLERKLGGLMETSICDDLQLLLTVRDSVGDRG